MTSATWKRLWKEEAEERRWKPFPDTEEGLAEVVSKGAMFATWMSFDGDPEDPETNRRGDFVKDFDDKENPTLALADMCESIIHLEKNYGLDSYQVDYFLSGGKGGHSSTPMEVIGAEPCPHLPLIYGKMALRLKAEADLTTMDTSLYCMGKGKQFRIENVKRSNGRHKVRVTPQELLTMGDAALFDLTKSPRDLDEWEYRAKPERCDKLHELYLECKAEVEAELEAAKNIKPLDPELLTKLKGSVTPCVNALLELKQRPPKGQTCNHILLQLAKYCAVTGLDRDQSLSLVGGFLKNYQGSTAYPTEAKRKSHFLDLLKFAQKNPETYPFNCSFMRGFGLSSFECGECELYEPPQEIVDQFEDLGPDDSEDNAEEGGNPYSESMIWGQEAIIAAFEKGLNASWRVDRVLPVNANLVVIWGPSDVYKSFLFGIDMGTSLSSGKEWHGLKVNQCRVLYCAGEGQAGAVKRLVGWQKHHGFDRTDDFGIQPLPPFVDDPKQAGLFIKSILALEKRPKVIILDTLARTMQGDENSTRDMSAFVNACKRITDATGAMIIVIHHCGKDEARGLRGSYALKAGADVEIKVTKLADKRVSVCCEKQKDYEKFAPMQFEMRVVSTGRLDADGNPVTTLVPELAGEQTVAAQKTAKLTGATRIAFESLAKALEMHGVTATDSVREQMDLFSQAEGRVVHEDNWRDVALSMGISAGTDDTKRRQFDRARGRLLDIGRVGTWDGYFWTVTPV